MKNEGPAQTAVEEQTKMIPSLAFLGLAGLSLATSVGLMVAGKRHWAMFVGQWVPTILILGTYNKLIKTFSAPSDEQQRVRHGGLYSKRRAPRNSTLISHS